MMVNSLYANVIWPVHDKGKRKGYLSKNIVYMQRTQSK